VVVLLGVSALAAAGPATSSDQFAGFAGVQLRASPDRIKTFAKQWTEVHSADRDDAKAHHYLFKGTPPVFEGLKVDKALADVSKRLHVVVGIALSLSGERCPQLAKALQRAWGAPFEVGGRNHELEWKGERVDASLEDDGPSACLLFIGDLGYDDEKDDWKKPR